MLRAENFQQEDRDINGAPVRIVTYQIGERFFCHIENKDPGATIARGEGSTRDEARQQALAKVSVRLKS
jgi:hypothetical protein